ncbi:nucleoside hydrolase [Actinomyces oris]|uniref:nucleoside hydrolase n=1 Tax=Actinomyces oris TaxID=544580 RepID=UPI0028D29F47|nr:nucleoside hydrolase [Actinomyces oris]
MMQRKILLDCDPGHDDAVAMMLAWGNPSIELLGVTTVGGNQTLDKVTRNALSVATVVGMHDVPIAAGLPAPSGPPRRDRPGRARRQRPGRRRAAGARSGARSAPRSGSHH